MIIDSCCDLPANVVNCEGVRLVPYPYFFGDEELRDDLWQSASAHDFYERMRKGETPTTAQVPIRALEEAFLTSIEEGMPAVYLCLSSALSGSYNTAQLVRDRLMEAHPDAELYVVDTLLASSGEGLLVYEALRQLERGLTARELTEWAEEARNFAHIYFMVDDLDALKRGGRIPSSVAFAGSKLDVKPILHMPADGTLAMKGIARGRKKGLKQLASLFAERGDKAASQYVVAGSSECSEDVQRLSDLICKDGFEPLLIEGIVGPVIGSHVGPGMVELAFWGPDRREDVSVADRIARKVKGE
ncbi:DegV family protein [Berryella wangjianweii]|uniref:DegV family protein n=1 Tax=Berryella wangjianweii TaxID=2734634 RepID=UPI0028F71758|nr:DegV family protein [Berryella wangjianweii]